jgi:hypothetical protein
VWPRSGRQAVGVDGSSVVLRVPAIDGAAAEVPAPPGPPPGGPPAVTWSGPLRQPVCRALRVGGVESLTISRGYPAPFIVDDSGLSYDDWGTDELRIVPPDPASAWARATRTIVLGRGHWAVRIEAEATMTATDGELVVEAALAATESGRVVARRHWAARIARDRC